LGFCLPYLRLFLLLWIGHEQSLGIDSLPREERNTFSFV